MSTTLSLSKYNVRGLRHMSSSQISGSVRWGLGRLVGEGRLTVAAVEVVTDTAFGAVAHGAGVYVC